MTKWKWKIGMYCMVTVLCVMVTTGAGCGLWWSVWPEPLSVGPCAAAAGPAWVIECLWTRDYHAYHDDCSVMHLHRHNRFHPATCLLLNGFSANLDLFQG